VRALLVALIVAVVVGAATYVATRVLESATSPLRQYRREVAPATEVRIAITVNEAAQIVAWVPRTILDKEGLSGWENILLRPWRET
jgi:HAMP domain-containing protein